MNNAPWDEAMPSLVDEGDGTLSTASSISKLSELLPQKLQFNGSGDSTDASTNPSVIAEGHTTEHNEVPQQVSPKDASGSKKRLQKKKKSIFSKIMKTTFRGAKLSANRAQNQNTTAKEMPPYKPPHTLHLADDSGNVECYILDAHAIRLEEQEKAKGLPPVGLVSDAYGNVECSALAARCLRTEEMKPPVEAVEEEVEFLAKAPFPQPSSDAAMTYEHYEETAVNCHSRMHSQLITPSTLNEPMACIDQENLNLPNSKDVVNGISKKVRGGLQFIDGTLESVVCKFFPSEEDINSIQGLSIEVSDTQVLDTQAEI
jgi:hypothetical protein